MLTQLQGEIKRCRELAERTTDDRFALLLYRIAGEVEQQAREAYQLLPRCSLSDPFLRPIHFRRFTSSRALAGVPPAEWCPGFGPTRLRSRKHQELFADRF
jgi:hypothetical protein